MSSYRITAPLGATFSVNQSLDKLVVEIGTPNRELIRIEEIPINSPSLVSPRLASVNDLATNRRLDYTARTVLGNTNEPTFGTVRTPLVSSSRSLNSSSSSNSSSRPIVGLTSPMVLTPTLSSRINTGPTVSPILPTVNGTVLIDHIPISSPMINQNCLEWKLYMEPEIPLKELQLNRVSWYTWLSKYGNVVGVEFKVGSDRDIVVVTFADEESLDKVYDLLLGQEFEIGTPFKFRLFK